MQTDEKFFTYSPTADRALAKAVAEIEDRVRADAAKGVHVDRAMVRSIAVEVLRPVFRKHRADGVTDSEPRAAISDRLDALLEEFDQPQPSWESYDLTLG